MRLHDVILDPPAAPVPGATPEEQAAIAKAYKDRLVAEAEDIIRSGLSLQEWFFLPSHERQAFVAAGIKVATVNAQMLAFAIRGGNPLALVDKDVADIEMLQKMLQREVQA